MGRPRAKIESERSGVEEWEFTDEQDQFFHYGPAPLLASGGFNAGKGLTLGTPIPTPSGWALMGSLSAGDKVFGSDGSPVTVIASHDPYWPKKLYEITFSDGSRIEADGEHLWCVLDHLARKRSIRSCSGTWSQAKIVTTDKMARSVRTSRSYGYPETSNYSIPNAEPLVLPDLPLPIDPYLLGVWLGDGDSNGGAFTSADPWIADEIKRRGHDVVLLPHHRSFGRADRYRVPGLTKLIRSCSLYRNKHVPAMYLRASVEQRSDLLAGLMDTDGEVATGNRHPGFCNTNLSLAESVHELLCSLGMRPSIREGRAKLYGKDCGPKWTVRVRPLRQIFKLPRKAATISLRIGAPREVRSRVRYVKSVVEIAPRMVRCITVDSKDGLYLAGMAMVPTHNTLVALRKLMYLCDRYPGYRVIVARRYYSELRQTTMQTFFKVCPPEIFADGSRSDAGGIGVVTLNNGSRFTFIHLARPDANSILMGLETNAALLDQAEEMHESTYDLLEGRLGRWDKAKVSDEVLAEFALSHPGVEWPYRYGDGRPSPPSHMLLTANPDIETHWLWRRFHPDSKEWKDKWGGMGYKMITFDSTHNRFASQDNIRILLSKDEAFQSRYVRGEWGNPEGVIFDVHPESILEPSPELFDMIKNTCRLHRVLDHGDSAPTCCQWYGVDGDGNLIFYREYYATDAEVRDHRKAIKELSKQDAKRSSADPKYTSNIADPSIFYKVPQRVGGRNVGTRWSVSEEYADRVNLPKEDAILWTPADNAEMASRQRLKDLLRIDPKRRHPITREYGSPRVFFVKASSDYPNGCEHAILELRSARKVQIGSMNGKPIFSDERDEATPDHALDCVRYAALSRPTAPYSQPEKKPGSGMTWNEYARIAKIRHRNAKAIAASSR